MVDQLDSGQLNRVWSPILSPLVWDLGHIANFEELWLVQKVSGAEPLDGSLGDLYDAIAQPRKVRGELPILPPQEVFPYLERVRERTLEVLEEVDLEPDSENPLLRDGFVYELILAHEHQHNETMLQLLQQIPGYLPPEFDLPGRSGAVTDGPEMLEHPGGQVNVGAPDSGFAYDNERPAGPVETAPFLIDRAPVTNRAYQAFLAETGEEPPMYWVADGDGSWFRERFGRREEIPLDSPVIHVSFNEAEAFAAWAGKRLPTEFEWETAANGSDRDESNLDHGFWDTAPAGSFAGGASESGAVQMLGDVWEWTSSEFEAYPGFEAFPYPEYSEVHFGQGYRVLRGGSWATRRHTVRASFRNWDLPERKQIFSGFRCAKDSV